MAPQMKRGPHDETILDPLGKANARIAAGDAAGAAEILRAQLRAGRGGLLARIALGRALLAAAPFASPAAIRARASPIGSGIFASSGPGVIRSLVRPSR